MRLAKAQWLAPDPCYRFAKGWLREACFLSGAVETFCLAAGRLNRMAEPSCREVEASDLTGTSVCHTGTSICRKVEALYLTGESFCRTRTPVCREVERFYLTGKPVCLTEESFYLTGKSFSHAGKWFSDMAWVGCHAQKAFSGNILHQFEAGGPVSRPVQVGKPKRSTNRR